MSFVYSFSVAASRVWSGHMTNVANQCVRTVRVMVPDVGTKLCSVTEGPFAPAEEYTLVCVVFID